MSLKVPESLGGRRSVHEERRSLDARIGAMADKAMHDILADRQTQQRKGIRNATGVAAIQAVRTDEGHVS